MSVSLIELDRMPSRQSVITNAVLRATVRPVVRAPLVRTSTLRILRGAIEGAFVAGGTDRIPHTVVDERVEGGRVRGEWVGPEPVVGEQVLLYAHGSAYSVCSPRSHRRLVASLARRTGRRAFSLDYRLGPEHQFPAAHDDMVRAFRWLLSRGHQPADILVGGDSAGGHLSLSLCGELRRLGIPMPLGMVLFSPLVDGTFETAAAAFRRSQDPTISPALAKRVIRHYFRTATPMDPRFDVSQEAGPDLPPTLLIAGGAEMMRGDAELWHEVQTAAGGRCEVQIWPGQLHVFPFLGLTPEARDALAEVERFVRDLDAEAVAVGDAG